MNENKYNGWSNYPTWRINLEILGDIQWDEYELETLDVEMLKNMLNM